MRFKEFIKQPLSAALIILVVWAVFAPLSRAAEPASPLEPLGLAGRLQGSLLMAVEKAFVETVLGQAQTRLSFDEGMDTASAHLVRLEGLVAARPGMERTGRYLAKLEQSRRAVLTSGRALLAKWRTTGVLDDSLAADLKKHRDQILYRVGQLIRHTATGLEREILKPGQRQSLLEAILVVTLQAKLLRAVNTALADNLDREPGKEVAFWQYLGEFDMCLAAYGAALDWSLPVNKTRAGLIRNLKALKHDVVISGEAVYLTARSQGQADVKSVRMLDSAADEAAGVLEDLLGLALER